MFLKRVELTGFKSFAAKTAVEFLPGVSIIVGPNGCGKSNIFDAVRWVLGEQSAKSLRGTKMDDVIFAGSASFKALSYAQVTLVISNENKKIPLDFAEISVTRRLFKTGESEYLLNKVNCRLKDIVDLFRDTGVGMDAYSFMEQGRVDQIIKSKPQDRRFIFEEAAGISKYKARKEEALRKLIRTEEDLLRVSDLIEEVRKNAESLKRQASKAERYKRLTAEYNEIEKRLLILRTQHLKEMSALVESQYGDVQARHAELSAKIAKLNSQNEESRSQSDTLTQELSESQSLAFELNTEIEKNRHQISLFKERIENADQTSAKLDIELADDRKRAAAFEQSIENIQNDFHNSEKILKETETAYQEKKARFESLKQTRQQRLLELEERRAEQSRHTTDKSRLQNEMRYVEAMLSQLQTQIMENKEVVASEKNQLDELLASLGERRQSLQTCEGEISAIRETINAALSELKLKDSDYNNGCAEHQGLVARLRDAESRLRALEELKQNYEGFERGVKTIMKAAEKGEMDGFGMTIASCITIPERYEQAMEIALGAGLQAIVSSDIEKAQCALDYLKEKKAGQAGFLPKDFAYFENTNGHMKPILDSEGVIDLARNLVEADEEQKPLFDALLGDTLIVDNLCTARRLISEGKRARFITLEGDCVEKNGLIIGGSEKRSGILSRERESRDLVKQIAQMKKQSQDLSQRLDLAKSEIESIRFRIDNLNAKLHARELDKAALLKDVDAAEKKYQDKLNALRTIEDKIAQNNSELGRYQQTIEQNIKQISALEQKIQSTQKIMDDLISSIDADKNEQEQLDETVSGLLMEQTRQRERYTALQQRLSAAKADLQSCRAAISKKSDEIKTIVERKAETIVSLKNTKETIQSLVCEKEELEREISLRVQERDTLILQLKKLGQEVSVLQRDFNEVQNTLHELDLKRTQHSTQLENLSQQAEEKFQKNLDAIVQEAGEVNGDRDQLINQMGEIKDKIDHIGPINAAAIDQYQDAIERYEFLASQQKDLTDAKDSLKKTIAHIDQTTTQLFNEAFEKIREYFVETFRTLFNGGRADLIVVHDPEHPNQEPGIDIIAQPPGKKLQNISLLSGGEKSLASVALLFAIFKFKPSPFCLLDEIDASLDDANVERFKELLLEFAHKTQFIVVTHNKQTMALADTVYGVTMEEKGVSKLVSVKFENIEQTQLAS
ncbi:MAG TPA: chromosome segregation protein SMC [Candidatus Sumerlaeota bacterium]|nr:chromosome segregation protein SMC [Candidatus Sumerlaeota bacterium]HON50072.1 chromosome segregation protein SMC [Candidatus Sumerlaeota bacterium]HOR63288.1 chromosome segregation protein SMC [Candidatus Sumerlaeota bacterium]HPL74039.1 chromosome segregation protein SMC [Candidatus Sumerlaeota bacterium]HRU54217.1 chromosome segregation protein SMC [Candidatus Sumerlaeia bacterium]